MPQISARETCHIINQIGVSVPAPHPDAATIRQQEREWWMIRVKALMQKAKYYAELDAKLQELVQEAMDESQHPGGEKR